MTPKNDLNTTDKSKAKPDAKSGLPDLNVVQMATVVYAIMGSLGALIMLYGHRNFFSLLDIHNTQEQWARILVATGLACGVLLIASYLCEEWFDSFQKIKATLAMMIGHRSYGVGIYLAALSAVGEELFFRGAVQPYAGLLFASFVFGLAHLGPDGVSVWTTWAFAAGLLIGWLTDATNSLWPAIMIHFIVNVVSLVSLQYRHRATMRAIDRHLRRDGD